MTWQADKAIIKTSRQSRWLIRPHQRWYRASIWQSWDIFCRMKCRLTALLGPANSETQHRPPKCNRQTNQETRSLTAPDTHMSASDSRSPASQISISAMWDRCCKNIHVMIDVFHNLTLLIKEFQKASLLSSRIAAGDCPHPLACDGRHSFPTQRSDVIHQLTFARFLSLATCSFWSHFEPHHPLPIKSTFLTLSLTPQNGSGAAALTRLEPFGLQGHAAVTASVSYEGLRSSRSSFDKKMSVF